ncbi:MAG: hypothetical protein JWP12_1612 [Bacteroidetes bacterium]|nr:hypothetical protein [Bacteroidota bacterium]
MKNNTKTLIICGLALVVVVLAGVAYYMHYENKQQAAKPNYPKESNSSSLSIIKSEFRIKPGSLEETLQCAAFLKRTIENCNCSNLFYKGNKRTGNEKLLQTLFRFSTR